MSATDLTINYLQEMFVANWSMLRENNGLITWLKWLEGDKIDDYCVMQAMRTIIQQRIDKERLDPMKDKPRLLEFQAVYYKELRERKSDMMTDEVLEDCEYCENQGYRYVVYHYNAYISSETNIKELPANEDIRKFCQYYRLPCSCKRGSNLKSTILESMKGDGRYVKPVDEGKQYRVLRDYSMTFQEATTLVNAYMKRRQEIFNPKTQRQIDDEKAQQDLMFKCFMKGARKNIHRQEKGI